MIKVALLTSWLLIYCAGCAHNCKSLSESERKMSMQNKKSAENIEWAGYDEKVHSNGWAEMDDRKIITYKIDGQKGPIYQGKEGVWGVFPDNEPSYFKMLDSVGGLKPGERKRIRTAGQSYKVTSDRQFIFILTRQLSESPHIQRGTQTVSVTDSDYKCFEKYLGYRKSASEYQIYKHQMDMIDNCKATLSITDPAPWVKL